MALRYAKGSEVPKFGITIINSVDYIYWSSITMDLELVTLRHDEILVSKTFEDVEWRFQNMEKNLSWLMKNAYTLETQGSEQNRKGLEGLVSSAYLMLEQAAEYIRTLK